MRKNREGESEKSIMHRAMIELTKVGMRLFRNTVGMAYQGKAERFTETTTVEVHPGDIVIRKARTIKAGLMTGSSDLVGWISREINEYDLGKVIAQFAAVEIKSEDGGLEPEQVQFLTVVRDSGGCAIVARSPEEAIERLKRGGDINE